MDNGNMPTLKTNANRRRTALFSRSAALAALAVMTAACTSTIATSDVDPELYDYRQRHPIMISEEPEVFNLRVGMNGPAISPEIETALRDYVDHYRADGTGSITIQVPTNSANAVAAASTGRAIHYALVRAGVPNSRIEVAPYYVGDHKKIASLRVSFLRVKAVTPTCGVWPDGSTGTPTNASHHNFGCAAQQNLAAMVANPADLVRPRSMSPANGERRARVIQIYVESGNVGWEPAAETALIKSDVGG